MRSNDVMNAEDVARYLNLGKNTVYQLAKTGQLASYKVGRKLRFSLEDVEAYIASTHQASAPAGTTGPVPAVQAAAEGIPDELSDAAAFGALAGHPFILAGEDVTADVIAAGVNAQGMPATRFVRGSYTALVNLYAGDADMAVVNLYDQKSNSYNLPYVRNLAPGASVVVFRLFARPTGFIVKAGNPKRLRTWGALLCEGVTVSNRVKGSGARVLLDEKLRALEARSETIGGYDLHAAVASAAVKRVASGMADVAIGTQRDTASFDKVEFVPLQEEWVDLVVAKSERTRPLVRTLKSLFADALFARELATFGSGDLSRLGTIIYES